MDSNTSKLENLKKHIQVSKQREAAPDIYPNPRQSDFKAPKPVDQVPTDIGSPSRLGKLREQIKARQDAERGHWKNKLRLLKLEHIKRTTPAAFEASGGYTMKVPPYCDQTTNGLTRCILDFLNYSGHWATRVNTQGQARIKKIPRYSIFSRKVEYSDKVRYTKSTTAKGTPDISSIIAGCGVQIEVKAGKDKIRDEQTVQGQRITEAGGLYFIAHDMPLFLAWYYETF